MITYPVAASADDGLEVGGTPTINGTNGVVSAATRYVGLSFDTSGNPIAVNQPLALAMLKYNPASLSTDDPDMAWRGHKVTNSAQYTTAANNISDRWNNNQTTASAADVGTSVGTGVRSIDVTAIVQELVNQVGWSNTSRIGLIAKGNAGANGSVVFWDNGANFATLEVTLAEVEEGADLLFIGMGIMAF